MTIDDWRVKYEILSAENDKLRVLLATSNANCAQDLLDEVERLREDAARNRWCEEKKASVFWSILAREWRVAVYDEAYNSLYTSKADRNAAIDAAMKGGK